jgi:catecholate siderophore receptor
MSLSRLRQSLNSASPAYLALGCFGLAASPAIAQAQEAPQESSPTRLGGMTVTDTVIEDTIKVDRVASPKFTQPLQDTPQTIQVIAKELFNQQGATTLAEALRNSAGAGTFYAGENGNTSTGDAIYLRGFDTSNSIFVDGIRDIAAVSRDIFNTDQVEVTKGPAGTDNGRSAPAGSINMVSKQANLDNALSGTASLGTDGQKRVNADLNQVIAAIPNAAFRLNAVWQDSDVPGRDHVNNKRFGIASSLGVGLGTDTRAYLNLFYMKQDNIPDGFVPTLGLPGWTPVAGLENLAGRPVASTNFYGTRNDFEDVDSGMVTLKLEHDFSDALKLTNVARWGKTRQQYLLTTFMTTAANIGRPVQADPLTYTLVRGATARDAVNDILTDQLNLRADFATGAIQHNLSAGVEFTRERQVNYNNITGSRPAANLLNPNWNDPDPFAVNRSAVAPVLSRGQTDTQAFYLFDTAKFFGDALLVTGGIRVDHYNTSWTAVAACTAAGSATVPACGSQPVGTFLPSADLTTNGTLFNWKLGAVYKPAENLSVYVNYAVSQQPPGGANFTLSSAANNQNNPNLDPQKAKTFEAGIKWSALGDQLAVNAAIFQTTVYNEINSAVLDALGNPTQTGRKRVRGIELSAVGDITKAWSLTASYSHLNTNVDNGPLITADGSPNLTYVPGDAFTMWTNYKLPFGLEIGGGVRYVGGLHKGTDTADTVGGTPAFTEGYTVVDAILAYPLTDNVKVRLNAYNLFDKDYVAAINKSGYRYTPGTPRTFLFSADFRF